MSEILLNVKNLKKYFKTNAGMLHAVDDVSFSIEQGHTMGVVGESGCGKSTLGRTLLQLYEPTSGEIDFKGKNIANLSKKEFRQVRPKLQMIFQDPYSSLNGRMTVQQLIAEPLIVNKVCKNKKEIQERHRHRYEVNNAYREELAAKGMTIAGTSPDGHIVEMIEIPANPFFVGTQGHPEFKSRPNHAHPLFRGFIKAAADKKQQKEETLNQQ